MNVTWGALMPIGWYLIAQSTRRFDQIGRLLQPRNSLSDAMQVLLLLGAIVGLAVFGGLVWLAIRWKKARRERPFHCPRRLFHELADGHELSVVDRKLMRDIATWHSLAEVSLLFVQPHRFRSRAMIETLGNAEQIARLEQQLFGEG